MKQFAVIGLGKFGYYLAIHLQEKGNDVMAIDKDPTLVQNIKDMVSQAIVADTTDKETIEELGLKDMDAVIVCIGTDMSASILTTLLLKDIGVRCIMAKANSEDHGRILEKLGASEILFPERDLAIFTAEKLHNPNLIDYLPFCEGYSIIQFAPPRDFIGKSLKDLNLINRYGVQVIAIKELVPERLNLIPKGNFIIKESDILIVLGPSDTLDKLKEG